MTLLLLMLLPVINSATPSAPQCALKAQPHIAMAPLRDAVVTVTVEQQGSPETLWRKAEVCLFEDDLRVRCSVLWGRGFGCQSAEDQQGRMEVIGVGWWRV